MLKLCSQINNLSSYSPLTEFPDVNSVFDFGTFLISLRLLAIVHVLCSIVSKGVKGSSLGAKQTISPIFCRYRFVSLSNRIDKSRISTTAEFFVEITFEREKKCETGAKVWVPA